MTFYQSLLNEVCIYKNNLENYCQKCHEILMPWPSQSIEQPKPVKNLDVKTCDEQKVVEEIKQVLAKAAKVKAKAALDEFKKKEAVQDKFKTAKQISQPSPPKTSGSAPSKKNPPPPVRPSSSSSSSVKSSTTSSRSAKSSGYKPAHLTAPFKTETNLPVRRRPRYSSVVTKKSTTPPKQSSAVVKQWVKDKPSDTDSPILVTKNVENSSSQRNANCQELLENDSLIGHSAAANPHLHRSMSMESVSNRAETYIDVTNLPKTTLDCATPDATETNFNLKIHAKLLQIPKELSRQHRQHSSLTEEALSYIQTKPNQTARNFATKMESHMNSRYKYRVRRLTMEFRDCYKMLRQFRSVIQYLDLEHATADQLCWCRHFFDEIVQTYTLLLHRYQSIVDDLDNKRDVPDSEEDQKLNQTHKEIHQRVQTWMRGGNTSLKDSESLSPFEVYRLVGCDPDATSTSGQIYRSVHGFEQNFDSVGYSTKKSADKFVELWMRIFERWKLLELQKNLSRNKTKLHRLFQQSVKQQQQPCAVFRQLSGIFCDRLPVTVKQKVDQKPS